MKRFHVHIAVDQLDSSVRFYSALFGEEPSVLKSDYAKWGKIVSAAGARVD